MIAENVMQPAISDHSGPRMLSVGEGTVGRSGSIRYVSVYIFPTNINIKYSPNPNRHDISRAKEFVSRAKEFACDIRCLWFQLHGRSHPYDGYLTMRGDS